MRIRRVVPDLHVDTDRLEASRAFYTGVLGLEIGMDLGGIVNLGSPSNETAQLQLMTDEATAPVRPHVSVEVDEIEGAWRRAQDEGYEIVHPLTGEPWGVRRLHTLDLTRRAEGAGFTHGWLFDSHVLWRES